MSRLVAVAGVMALFSFSAPTVLAAWSAQGTGSGAAAAATMPAGGQPVGSVTATSVSLRWPAVTLSSGAPVAGYVVQRFDAASGTAATVGAGCSGTITTTTCTELLVLAGTWIYTVTPVLQSWTGAPSPASAALIVL